MRPATWVALAVVGVLLVFLATTGSSLYLVVQSEHRWCDTLTLLTSRPVSPPRDPAQDPSRAGQYRLYQDFVRLRAEFGC